MAGQLTLGPSRPWGSMVATPESPEEPEQLPQEHKITLVCGILEP